MHNSVINVLVIEDNSADFLFLRTALDADPLDDFKLTWVERLGDAFDLLTRETFELVLLDLSLPDGQGIDTFFQFNRRFPEMPVVVCSGNSDEQVAIEAVRAGAQDYLVKSQAAFEMTARTIRYAIERKRAENALRAEQLRFARLAATVPGAITMLHAQSTGRFELLYASAAFEDIFGLALADLSKNAEAVIQRIPPADAQSILARLAELASILQPISMEFRYQHPLKGEIWLENRSQPMLESDGSVVWYGITNDITERKQTEKELEETRKLFQKIFTASPIPMALSRISDRTVVDVNAAMENLLGYARAELAGKPATNFNYWADLQVRQRAFETLLTEGKLRDFEFSFRTKAGAIGQALNYTEVFEQGHEKYFLSIFVDITERKHTEAIVYAQRDLVRSISQVDSLETGLRLCLENAINLSRLDSGGIYLFNSMNDQLELVFHQGLGPAFIEAVAVYPPDAPNVKLISSGQSFYLSAADSIVEQELYRQEGLQALAVAPIQHQGKVIGCLNLASHSLAQVPEHGRKALETLAVEIGNFVEYLHAQASLRESEERFRSLFENTGVVMLIIEPDSGQIMDANPAAVEFYGYSREQFISMNMEQIDQLPMDELVATRQKADKEGQHFVIVPHRLANGCLRTVEVHNHLITTRGGPSLYSIIFDVTERKKVEDDALYRQKLLEKVLQLGKNVTAIPDLDACLRQIHHSIRQGLGFERIGLFLYNLVDNTVSGVYGTNRNGQIEENNWYKMSVGQGTDWQVALKAPSGISFDEDYQNTYHPAPDNEMYGVGQHVTLAAWSGDKPVALIAVDNLFSRKPIKPADLEALQLFAGYAGLAIANAQLHAGLEQRIQQRSAELEAIRQRLELATQTANLGVWDWNIRTGELFWDDEVYVIYGQPRDSFERSMEAFLSIIHPDDISNLLAFTQDALAGHPASQAEYRVIRADHTVVYVKVHGVILRDADGQPENIVGVVQDITQEKLAEKNLLESRDKLSAANTALEKAARAKDEFLANMSHELRTPLNSILGMSEILMEGIRGSLNERQYKMVETIDSSGRHLLSLINDILDLSKIEAEKLDLFLEKTSIDEVCHACLSFIKEPAMKKGVEVHFIPDPSVTFVQVDIRRLKQILVNLLSNAVKFTPAQGKVTLTVRAELEQNYIQFSVSDTGIGIAQDDLESLFQPFTQVDNSLTRRYDGTGLGLALVKRLVELHGGTISVTSEIGQGSCFTVSLPWRPGLSPEVLSTLAVPPASANPLANSVPKKLGTILLAEDNEANIMTIGDYLEVKGYQMIYAHNGREALEKASETSPDLILMDVQMPEMDGLEATRRLRTEPRFARLPIIALTALAMEGDRDRCMEAGATEYISKPVSLKQLVELIQLLLNTREAG